MAGNGTLISTRTSNTTDTLDAPAIPDVQRDIRSRALSILAILLGAEYLANFCATLTLHGDVFWHEVFGSLILAHGIIHYPVLTYTTHNRFVEPEWIFDLVLHGFVVAFGPLAGARIMTAILVLVIYLAVCLYTVRTSGLSDWRVGGAVVITALTLRLYLGAHPETLGYVLWILALLVTIAARRNAKYLLLLIPIAVVWVNVDGTFLLLLVLVGAEVGLAVLNRLLLPIHQKRIPQPLSAKYLGITVVGIVLAMSVSPYGIVALVRSQVSASLWRPMKDIVIWEPFTTSSVVVMALILIAFMVSVFALLKHQGGLVPLAAIAGIAVGMTTAILLPYGLLAAAIALGSMPANRILHLNRPRRLTYTFLSIVVVVIMALSLSISWGGPTPPQTDAPTLAAAHLPPKSDRIFTTYYWADWLVYLHRPAFVYGETFQWVDTPILTEYTALINATINPIPVFHKYNIHYALLPTGSALGLYLQHADGWRDVWHDSTAVLLTS